MKIKRKNNHCLEEEPKFSWLFCYLKNSFHYLSILLLFFKPVYSLVAQRWKYPPTMWETWVWSLGWEDPLEKGKATHSSILAGEFHELYSPWGRKESDTTEWLSLTWEMATNTLTCISGKWSSRDPPRSSANFMFVHTSPKISHIFLLLAESTLEPSIKRAIWKM